MRSTYMGLFAMVVVGCDGGGDEPLTAQEAREAVDATVTAESGAKMTSEAVELTTRFTLGQAAEATAEELAAWFSSQIPCSSVSREGTTLTVDFGELEDACAYNGRTWAGLLTVSIDRSEESSVELSQTWDGLTDGTLTLDGAATVTLDGSGTRQVSHSYSWQTDAHTVTGSGARSWQRLASGDGLVIDGDRSWDLDGLMWDVEIQTVEVRAQDPVPQSGAYVVTNPAGKELTLSFARVDDDTIAVTVSGGARERTFEVSGEGAVSGDPIEG